MLKPKQLLVLRKNQKSKVDINVRIGDPYLECMSLGLCGATIIISLPVTKENESMLVGNDDGQVALLLAKNKFKAQELKDNFGTKTFTLKNDFIFSEDIHKKFNEGLENPVNINLKKGTYPIKETKNYIIIPILK